MHGTQPAKFYFSYLGIDLPTNLNEMNKTLIYLTIFGSFSAIFAVSSSAQSGERIGKTISSGKISQGIHSGKISEGRYILSEKKLSDIVILSDSRSDQLKSRKTERVAVRRETTQRIHRKKKKNNL